MHFIRVTAMLLAVLALNGCALFQMRAATDATPPIVVCTPPSPATPYFSYGGDIRSADLSLHTQNAATPAAAEPDAAAKDSSE